MKCLSGLIESVDKNVNHSYDIFSNNVSTVTVISARPSPTVLGNAEKYYTGQCQKPY